MAIASVDAGGEFRIGTVIKRTFTVYGANVLPFVAVTFVAALPNLLVLLPSPESAVPDPTKTLIAVVLGVYLNSLAQAVILFGAFGSLRGEPIRLGEALHRTLARLFPILGFATLYSLGLFGGLMLAVVPGLILAVMWAVALPACAFEGLGPIDCLRRSARLAAGYRWKVFWLLALLTIVLVATGELVELALRPAGVYVKASASLIWAAVSGAYWNCAFVILYRDLRAAKEGADAEQIAAIFD